MKKLELMFLANYSELILVKGVVLSTNAVVQTTVSMFLATYNTLSSMSALNQVM